MPQVDAISPHSATKRSTASRARGLDGTSAGGEFEDDVLEDAMWTVAFVTYGTDLRGALEVTYS